MSQHLNFEPNPAADKPQSKEIKVELKQPQPEIASSSTPQIGDARRPPPAVSNRAAVAPLQPHHVSPENKNPGNPNGTPSVVPESTPNESQVQTVVPKREVLVQFNNYVLFAGWLVSALAITFGLLYLGRLRCSSIEAIPVILTLFGLAGTGLFLPATCINGKRLPRKKVYLLLLFPLAGIIVAWCVLAIMVYYAQGLKLGLKENTINAVSGDRESELTKSVQQLIDKLNQMQNTTSKKNPYERERNCDEALFIFSFWVTNLSLFVGVWGLCMIRKKFACICADSQEPEDKDNAVAVVQEV